MWIDRVIIIGMLLSIVPGIFLQSERAPLKCVSVKKLFLITTLDKMAIGIQTFHTFQTFYTLSSCFLSFLCFLRCFLGYQSLIRCVRVVYIVFLYICVSVVCPFFNVFCSVNPFSIHSLVCFVKNIPASVIQQFVNKGGMCMCACECVCACAQ